MPIFISPGMVTGAPPCRPIGLSEKVIPVSDSSRCLVLVSCGGGGGGGGQDHGAGGGGGAGAEEDSEKRKVE